MPQPGADSTPGPRNGRGGRRAFVRADPAVGLPFLYPPIPPLVDRLGHMGRYRLQMDLATSPWLTNITPSSGPIGKLGGDLLIIPMRKIFGRELGVKLIVLAIRRR